MPPMNRNLSEVVMKCSIGEKMLIGLVMIVASAQFSLAGNRFENEIFVKFKPHMTQEQIEVFAKEHHLEIVEHYQLLNNLFLCRVPEGENVSEWLQNLNRHPDVEYAERNQEVRALQPNL